MPWFKVDDKLHSHKKAARAGADALGLWVLAGSWCMDQLTDGFIPDYVALRFDIDADQKAARLVKAGLWFVAEHDGDQGWQFHDWEAMQPTREDVESGREAARERMRKAREGRRSEHKNDSSAEVRANNEGTSPAVAVTPTRPDPTRSSFGTTEGRAPAKRGTRIPDGYAVSQPMREWATAKGFAHLPLDDITEEFVDYWRAVAGAKGVKLDWEGTWRNWIRRKAGDGPKAVRADDHSVFGKLRGTA